MQISAKICAEICEHLREKTAKMKTFSLLSALLFCANLFAQNAPIELAQAVTSQKITVQVKGLGGYHGKCIRLGIKNVTPQLLSISVPEGWVFVSDDTTVQDLMVTLPIVMSVKPNEIQYVAINTVCTQHHNASPSRAESFSLGKKAEGNLLKLAQYLAQNKYISSTAQSAVWAVADGDKNMKDIYGENLTEVRGIARLVSEMLAIPMPQVIVPRPHHITNISTSLEWRTDMELPAAKLEVFDENGILQRTYFENKNFTAGFQQWKFGFFHTDVDSTKRFFVRLSNGEELISQRWISPQDSVLQLHYFDTQTLLHFDAAQETAADVAIYDEKGDLYFPLTADLAIQKGHHNKTFIIGKRLPIEKNYTLKIRDKTGKVIAEKTVNPAETAQKYDLITLSKVVNYKVEKEMTGASLLIVNDKNEVCMSLYKNSHIYPGEKKYSYTFKHFMGPQMKFRIRLTDSEGNVVMEQPVN